MSRGGVVGYWLAGHLPNEVLAAQVRLLTQRSVIDILIYAASAALVGAGFAISGTVSYPTILVWEALFISIGVIGAIMAWRYRRFASDYTDSVPPPNIFGWVAGFTFLTGCSSLAWSSLIFLFWASPTSNEIVMLAGAAMLGNIGALTKFLPLRATVRAAVLGVNVPVVAKLIFTGTTDGILLAGIVTLVGMVIYRAGTNTNAALAEWLALRFENRDLVSQLRTSLLEAEFANNAKSMFLGNISHEFRTPLNAIIGFAELMQQKVHGDVGDSRYSEYVDHIAENSNRLLAMINNVLDLSKLETQGIDLEEDEFELEQVIGTTVDMMRPAADERAITVRICPCPPYRISADRTRFKQILINLLSNAIKFSEPGQSVEIGWCETEHGELAISIRDDGIGMHPEETIRLLKPFEQAVGADGALSAAGLGLPLSKAFAELHGATLELESKPGSGTVAVVKWPANRVQAQDLLQEMSLIAG